MQLFYCPELADGNVTNYLSEQESKHCIRVLRRKVGDEINLIDGKGGKHLASIITANPKKCEIKVISSTFEELTPYYIHIAIAPTKNFDKTEWFIEKCVEFGIDEISFIQTNHSERKIVKDERVFRTALSACKQAIKPRLPKINKIENFDVFLRNNNNPQKFIAYVNTGEEDLLKNKIVKNGNYCVLIGPEGGFTPEEVKAAGNSDFTPVSLGKSRLRTETAGIAACHILNLFAE